jgi:hypothetical protein
MAVNPIKVWNGTAWEYTGPVVAAPPVKYQATQPSSPATGDVWVESDVDVATFDPSQIVRGGAYVNEAARASAITSPVTGMITYVGDTGTDSPASTIPQIQAYNGSAWQNTDGLTLLANVPFTTASFVNVDNVFTSTYQNYKIVMNLTASSISAGAGITWRGRTGGSNITTGTYGSQYMRGVNTTVNAFTGGSASIGGVASGSASYVAMEATIFSPQLAQATTTNSPNVYVDATGAFNVQLIQGYHNGANQFDGINIYPDSGTFTGTVRIYGLRNS